MSGLLIAIRPRVFYASSIKEVDGHPVRHTAPLSAGVTPSGALDTQSPVDNELPPLSLPLPPSVSA